jgi:hypothetical protein
MITLKLSRKTDVGTFCIGYYFKDKPHSQKNVGSKHFKSYSNTLFATQFQLVFMLDFCKFQDWSYNFIIFDVLKVKKQSPK